MGVESADETGVKAIECAQGSHGFFHRAGIGKILDFVNYYRAAVSVISSESVA
jgi:hypothetical protein